MSIQAKINWGAMAAWTSVMLTMLGLAGRGVLFLGEIAIDVKSASNDIRAIRADMGRLNERVDGIDKWRVKVDEKLKISGIGTE